MEEDDRRIINKCEYSETRRDVARRNETWRGGRRGSLFSGLGHSNNIYLLVVESIKNRLNVLLKKKAATAQQQQQQQQLPSSNSSNVV
jgi:hypothetical protein